MHEMSIKSIIIIIINTYIFLKSFPNKSWKFCLILFKLVYWILSSILHIILNTPHIILKIILHILNIILNIILNVILHIFLNIIQNIIQNTILNIIFNTILNFIINIIQNVVLNIMLNVILTVDSLGNKIRSCLEYFTRFHSIRSHRCLNKEPFFPIRSGFPAIFGFWGDFWGSWEKSLDF